jgi:hypothetical protein
VAPCTTIIGLHQHIAIFVGIAHPGLDHGFPVGRHALGEGNQVARAAEVAGADPVVRQTGGAAEGRDSAVATAPDRQLRIGAIPLRIC